MCAGQVSLKLFHTFLSERLPHLGHIQLYSVQVVDHLGRIIPVPTQFCSSWKVDSVSSKFWSMAKIYVRNLHISSMGTAEIVLEVVSSSEVNMR